MLVYVCGVGGGEGGRYVCVWRGRGARCVGGGGGRVGGAQGSLCVSWGGRGKGGDKEKTYLLARFPRGGRMRGPWVASG